MPTSFERIGFLTNHGSGAGLHRIRLSEHFEADADVLFRHACALGLEGITAQRALPLWPVCGLDQNQKSKGSSRSPDQGSDMVKDRMDRNHG